MKNITLTPVALALAILLGACSSMPASTTLLEQTRNEYRAAQSSPAVGTYAAAELQQAGEAMSKANTAAAENLSDDKIDALAYLAKQKIALTQEVAKQKSAEAEVANAGKQRDQMLLAQRTNEADQAKLKADQAAREAAAAQNATAQAQGDALDERRKAQEALAHASQLEAQLAELSAKKTERGMVITIGDVLFATDSSTLTAEGTRSAQKLATVLQENPQRTVMVEGFTDNTGSNDYNQALSERRANAVAAVLQGLGVARERITTRGYGESNPVASNRTAGERQLNRRVEIILSDDSGKIAHR